MKKRIALILAALLALGLLGGCQQAEPAQTTETTSAPTPTQSPEEAKVLKILTLGSSSSVDAFHMLNMVAAAEGVEQELVIGTLYYSGCKFSQHVKFLRENSPVYQLYLSSSAEPNNPPSIMESVTMQMALRQDCWDIIFLQGGGGETSSDEGFTNGNIEIIKNYVLENKLNPEAVFGYHAIGISSTDKDLIATYPLSPNTYETSAAKYDYDRTRIYAERVDRLQRFVETDTDYQYRIYSITAVENAITSYLGQKGIKRDYTHLTDIGRLIVAYCCYCELYGIEELTEVKLDAITRSFLKTTPDKTKDRVLTDTEKALILEAVNNTIKNPLTITQSKITEG